MPEPPPNAEVTVGPPDLGWTVTTLKAHFDAILSDRQRQVEQLRYHYNTLIGELDRRYEARFATIEHSIVTGASAQEKAITAALSSSKEALNKADAANEKRFDGVNEFRATLADQQRTLMPRAESLALHAATQEKFESAAANRLLMMPRAEAVSSLTSLQEKIDSLQARIDRNEGRGSGLQAGWGYVVGGAGLLLTLLTIGGILLALGQ